MNLREKVETFYQFFYVKVSRNTSFLFCPSGQQVESIKEFCSYLDNKYGVGSVGINMLFEYFSFQFAYWANKNTKFNGNVFLNWIIGKDAIKRWEEKNEHAVYFALEFSKSKQILKSEIEYVINFDPDEDVSYEDLFENERKRFFNTKLGFVNCLSLTSLFSNVSPSCVSCNFSIDCKSVKTNREKTGHKTLQPV